MSTPTWAPGTTYLPGDIVQARTVTPATVTEIDNYGAETGDLSDWTISSGGGTWSVNNSSPANGTYKFNWNGTSSAAVMQSDTQLPVTPGQAINITAAINPYGAPTALSQNGGFIRIDFYTAGDAYLSSAYSPQSGLQNSGWWVRTASAVAPSTAAYAKASFQAFALQGGNVAFDSVQVSYPGGTVDAGLVYKAVQAGPGVSDSVEPAWPTTLGVTVVDNTVTWEAVSTSRVVWEASPIMVSGGTEPTWPTAVGERVTDGTISWEAVSRRVEDVNCPNTKVVAIMASKVFAVDGDIVRYSATINPLDWTTPDDAGYLPTGLQQSNANDMAVLAPYRSNLMPMNASCLQNWQVDPDPAAMALIDQMDGVGSTQQGAAQPVANDLFYLSQLGVRSVSISVGAENLSAGDIGMPIDSLVQAAMQWASTNETKVLATYYPSAGQYWLAFDGYEIADLDGNEPPVASFTVS